MPTYEELLAIKSILEEENRRKDERIAYLERMLYGSKRDKRRQTLNEGPGLFEDEFNEALDERQAAIERTAAAIRAEADRRRKQPKKQSARPEKYRYQGLEERKNTVYPENINLEDYDVIGVDVTRILHRSPAKVWVEVVERPILRHKSDRNLPCPRIEQAQAPKAVIGGNHVAADMLAQIVIDKYTCHLPEYRQVRQYADLGVRLPASTINDWVHAVANRLYPLYEAHQEDIRSDNIISLYVDPFGINSRFPFFKTGGGLIFGRMR